MAIEHAPPVPMKLCTDCGQPKPVSDFGAERRNRSGLASRCKACSKVRTYGWREKNRERYNVSAKIAYHRRVKNPAWAMMSSRRDPAVLNARREATKV